MSLSEAQAIELLERIFRSRSGSRARVGIGDDAAVLDVVVGDALVCTVDAQVEGVHFRRDWLSLEDVGWRALASAVSDVAAMGARPVAVLSSLILPPTFSKADLRALGRGQAAAARGLACRVVGGNIARGRELSLTTTVLGEAERPLLRSGAKAGDEVWLVGSLGLARAGFLLLEAGLASSRRRRAIRRSVDVWRRPQALVSEGRRLAGVATAAIDVSDGLGRDAAHLARASRVAIVIDRAAVEKTLGPELAIAATALGTTALDLALVGGEDYALLATGPKGKRPRRARVIGVVERGRGAWLRTDDRRLELADGFDHLSGR